MLLFAITVLKQDANALMLGEFPVVMDLVGSVEAAKEAKQQVVIMVMVIVMVMRIMMVRIVMVVMSIVKQYQYQYQYQLLPTRLTGSSTLLAWRT